MFFDFTLYFIFFAFVLPAKTYAYLDPGTGSMMIQVVIGFVVGGLYLIKLYWKKIVNFFSTRFGNNDKKKVSKAKKS